MTQRQANRVLWYNRIMIFICDICHKSFINYKKNRPNRYCSKNCLLIARKTGQFNPMQGKKHTGITKHKMSISAKKRVIEKPNTIPDWRDRQHTQATRLKMMEVRGGDIDRTKGNYRIGYVNIHKYIRKRFDIKNKCGHCGKECKTQIANKTGNYLKNISDWLELCPKCHYKYDKKNGLNNKYVGDIK